MLEVFFPDSCCNIVGGLIPAIWEKRVVWDVCPGVGSITAMHNNYLVVTAFERGRGGIIISIYHIQLCRCTPSPVASSWVASD